MLKLSVKKLIKSNTFFSFKDCKIEYIKNNSDALFGEEFKMYYFYRKGYNISFVYNEIENVITSEQVEVTIFDEIENEFLKRILSPIDFKRELNNEINSFYFDENGEDVAFLNNGVNVHFNNNILSKITSKNDMTRDFVVKFMTKA